MYIYIYIIHTDLYNIHNVYQKKKLYIDIYEVSTQSDAMYFSSLVPCEYFQFSNPTHCKLLQMGCLSAVSDGLL